MICLFAIAYHCKHMLNAASFLTATCYTGKQKCRDNSEARWPSVGLVTWQTEFGSRHSIIKTVAKHHWTRRSLAWYQVNTGNHQFVHGKNWVVDFWPTSGPCWSHVEVVELWWDTVQLVHRVSVQSLIGEVNSNQSR